MTRRALIAAVAVAMWTMRAVAAGPELTEEQRERTFDLAIDFTQCAGLNWALSDVAPMLGRSAAEAQNHKEIGNGSWTAAFYLFWSIMGFEKARDLASDQSDMHRNTWLARLDRGGDDIAWAGALSLIEKCLEINPIQVELVEQFRKDMHLRGVFDPPAEPAQ